MDLDDVLATLAVSRSTGTPVTSRGGGTSVAGNAIGPGIVIDFARHLNRIVEIDEASGAAHGSSPVWCWPICNDRPRRWACGSGRTRRPRPGRPWAG